MVERERLLWHLIECSERVREAVVAAERRSLAEIVGLGADGAETSGIDFIAENAALDYLESIEPGCNILSEEIGFLDRGAMTTLIVDPIDATGNATAAAELTLAPDTDATHRMPPSLPRHSGQYGFPYYAFSVGAVEAGQLVAACVRNLPTGDVFTAVRGQGSRLNGVPIRCEPVQRLSDAWVALVRSSDPEGMRRFLPLVRQSGRIRITGCTSLDLCLIASGTLHAFANPNTHLPHGCGEKVVDYAGALLVLEEAGGCASDGNGHPLSLAFDLARRTTPFAAATPELLREMRELVQAVADRPLH